MIVFNHPQRSLEWHAARRGVFTASELGRWIMKDKWTKTDLKAVDSLINRKLAQVAGADMPLEFETWEMKRGTALEPEARRVYSETVNNEVEEVGFVLHHEGVFGCSPDGFCDDRSIGLEMKCPLGPTQVKYLREERIPEQYEVQLQVQLAITNVEFIDFFSYCPGLPIFLMSKHHDDQTKATLEGLYRLMDRYRDAKRFMADKWQEMKDDQAD